MPNRDVMADDVVPEQGLGDRFAALFQKKPHLPGAGTSQPDRGAHGLQ
jgi:hypothetical protein